MDSIRQRFLQAERDFLFAIGVDNQLLVDFAESWEKLQSDWESSLHLADEDTQQFVGEVAARIGELTGDFCAFRSQRMSLEDGLFSDIEDLFSSLSLDDRVVVDPSPNFTAKLSPPPSPGHNITSPSQWLLRNLHNPYPLPHITFSLNQTAGSKHTKEWFTKARQRIGWTRLLRDRFAGSRSLATDAAFRAFVRDDPHNPLDTDLKTAFLAIKSHAELVYGNGSAAYPCPQERPRSISPTPSLTFSSGPEDSDDELHPTPLLESNCHRCSKRPPSPVSSSQKRRRTRPPPSPALKAGEPAPTPHIESTLPRPRKRRLSGSDCDYTQPKRPRGVEGHRLHAVSDPLVAAAASTWFDFNRSFRIPSPASVDPLESSFDLDFFNPPSLPSYTVSSVPASSINDTPPVDDFSALFEIPQLDLFQPTLSTLNPDWTEFLNFQPDLSFFRLSPSTPPFVDDDSLPPSSPFHSSPLTPNPILDILPGPDECKKAIQFPTAGEPVIQGRDSLFPLASTLLLAC